MPGPLPELPVILNVCAVDPAFVAYDRAGGGDPVGHGLLVDDTDDAGPRQRACQTSRLASHKQIAADLLPEAGNSGAVEAEQRR